jgi:thymidylate synthase
MNSLDAQYQDLLQAILDYGVEKKDRTGTGTKSIFGYTIRHKMSWGFPLLTTKKMAWKTMVTELLWFLRGDTNIKFLVDNGCNIWNGDAFKNFMTKSKGDPDMIWNQDQFIHLIKTDDEFAKEWGDLGPIYGKQWRSWTNYPSDDWLPDTTDQIQNLINELKTNPDSRRLMVNAWNVGELDQMVLPPCHYGFQVYTRELSLEERTKYKKKRDGIARTFAPYTHQMLDNSNIPTRAISLMWNQRSVDTFLGLPFNIASYGLLLEIIAKMVNMVPDELIGNLGDTHLYLNHVEQAKEQIGRELTFEEKIQWVMKNTDVDMENLAITEAAAALKRTTRQPYPLPTLNINTEFWPTESGECGVGPLDATAVLNSFKDDNFCRCLLEEDLQLVNYQSHPAIKAPLSN